VLNAWIGGVEESVGKYVDALWDARRFTKSTQKDLRCGVLWRLRPDADSRDCCGRQDKGESLVSGVHMDSLCLCRWKPAIVQI